MSTWPLRLSLPKVSPNPRILVVSACLNRTFTSAITPPQAFGRNQDTAASALAPKPPFPV